jgi:glucokinase
MKDTVVSEANPKPYHSPSKLPAGQPPIGIDIGGTKINAAVVKPHPTTGQDELLSLMNSPTPTDSETFLNTLTAMIKSLREEHNVSAVGIATAGVVDSIHGRILGSTGNMPALKNLSNLKEQLEATTGLPVHIENDANAAAYGEWRSGAAKGATNMFAITLGTGVGMGIVFDGKMYRGSHFYAAEGGHIAISYKRERKCTCGRWDCWEAFASGNGLQKTAELTVEAAPETAQQEFKANYCENGEVTTYAVIAAWKDNNHIGVQIMDEWHNHIAVGLSGLINVMDPDLIVVGGGLAQFVDFELLLERTRERTMSNAFQLIPAALGNHAGIVGAAYLALESNPSV